MDEEPTPVQADPLFDLRGPMWGIHHRLAGLPRTEGDTAEERRRLLEEELAVRDTLSRYTYYYDGKDLDSAMSLFHQECVLITPWATWIGKDAIRRNLEYQISSRKFAFHQVTNLAVRLRDDGRCAWITCYYTSTAVDHAGGMSVTGGTFADRLVKVDGEWKFIERRFTYNYRHVLSPQPPGKAAGLPEPSKPETARDLIEPEYMM